MRMVYDSSQEPILIAHRTYLFYYMLLMIALHWSGLHITYIRATAATKEASG